MSDFFKKFLAQDPRRAGASGYYVALAAFGKHPGWDDHVEDLGLETESLNLAKTLLYVNGIGGQIDSGAWEKLDPGQQLPAFNHVFVWQRSGQMLIGRLWSSSDGKGRTRYPMVVCLHFAGATLGWALKAALPVLAQLQEGCAATTSAEDVRSLLARSRAALRTGTQSSAGRGEYAPVTPDALHRILQPPDAGKREGFLRVLYQIQSQLGAFTPRKFNARANPAALQAQQIRVPAAGDTPEQALLFWTRFFLTLVDDSVPLLLTLPLEADWVDVTVGEPGSHEFFCLRASPKAVPMVSEVPYTLEETFREKANAFLDGFQRGETGPADLPPPATTVIAMPTPAKSWRKWLGFGVIIILSASAAIFFFLKHADRSAQSSPAGAKPEATPQLAKDQPAAQTQADRATARVDAPAEAVGLAEQKKKSDAVAAAAKLKADAEAAAQDKTRQLADAVRLAKEKEAVAQKDLQEKQRKAAELEARARAGEEARAKVELAAVAPAVVTGAGQNPAPIPLSAPAGTEMTNSIGMVLVVMPWGLWVGKYEVTQAEFQKVMGANPSKSVQDRQPVEQVSWNDAAEFCRKLTALERNVLRLGQAYALPTQQQWTEFAGGLRFQDLPRGGFSGRAAPSPVGQSGPPNKFGLFDVLGNVWEWCLDGGTADAKLLKGGAFNKKDAYDQMLPPAGQMPNCGFRCVLASQ